MSAISVLDVVAPPPPGTVPQGAQPGAADVFGPLLANAVASAQGGPKGSSVSDLMGLLAAFDGPAQATPQCIEALQAVLARHQAAGVDAQGVMKALGLALERLQASEGAPENEPVEFGGIDMDALLTLVSAIVGPEVLEAAMAQVQTAASAGAASFEASPPAPQQAEAMPPYVPGSESPAAESGSGASGSQAAFDAAGQAVAAEAANSAEPGPQAQLEGVQGASDTPAASNPGVEESRSAMLEPAAAKETGQADTVLSDAPQTVNEALQQQSARQPQSPSLAVSAGTAEFAAPEMGQAAKRPMSEQDMLALTGEKLLQALEAASIQTAGEAPGAQTTVQTASGVDQQRMIDRIANAISNAANSGRSTIRLRLYPPELGTVRIEVSSVRGVVTARIEASTSEAQQALNANLGTLRENLRGAGVDVRGLEVNYRNPSAHLGLGQQHRDNGGYEPQARRSWSESRQPQEAENASQLALQTVSAGLLDVLM